MPNFIDLTGHVYGRLTVSAMSPERYVRRDGRSEFQWECECECGRTMTVRGNSLRTGNTSSCGCSRWKGDAPGYKSVHAGIVRARGSATGYHCNTCGVQADEWSYTHSDPDEIHMERIYPSGYVGVIAYSADPSHYVPLCTSCHRGMDVRRAKARRRACSLTS